MLSCPETAFRTSWIDRNQPETLATTLGRCTYGQYLLRTSLSKKSWSNRRPRSRTRVRDRSHITNCRPRIVSTQTSRGDTNMRKFILIAGFVLASAAVPKRDHAPSEDDGAAMQRRTVAISCSGVTGFVRTQETPLDSASALASDSP